MPEAARDLVEQTLSERPGDPAGAAATAPASSSDWLGAPRDTAESSASGGPWVPEPARSPALTIPTLRVPRRRVAVASRQAAAVAVAFAAGVAAVFVLFIGVALAVSAANSNRVLPGVRIGSVDVSGLTRPEVVAKLRASYSYLSQGQVQVKTPSGSASVSYAQLRREPDVEFMADEAMNAGRSGDAISDAMTVWRTALSGRTLPLAIQVDPTMVAAYVREMSLTSVLRPRDAQATLFYGTFIYYPSARGSQVDEQAVGSQIIDHLTESNTPTQLQAGQALVILQPKVSDEDAQAAIKAAERMAVDITLSFSPSATASPTPSAGKSAAPPKTYQIPAATVRSWIVFRTDANGKYGPDLDLYRVQAYIGALPGTTLVAPVEPHVVFDSAGVPTSVEGGQNGVGADAGATASAIQAYLLRLAGGGSPEPFVPLAVGPIPPRINVTNLSGLTVIGSWTTIYYPGITNGYGANIHQPAVNLNGQIVAPGQQFSFMQRVGPIDAAHGFTLGGVILHGKSDHTGAMGGGICSASTTMFNAAARAGLRIDERWAHTYYIDRYPEGLDATVFSNGGRVWDTKWTNDTPNPIVIRSWTAGRSKSSITIQLWSLPLDRTVVFNPENKSNIIPAGDSTVYTDKLAPGETNRAEYPTAGFDTVRTRTVTDSTGKQLYFDTWVSHYIKVDGVLEIGGPGPTPTPTPTAIFVLPALTLLRVLSTMRPRRAS